MTAGMIDMMHGISTTTTTTQPATTPTFRNMPSRLSPSTVVATLQALGLTIPTKLSAAAAKGEALRAAAHRFPLQEVDAALSKANVPITDRFRFKEAMDQNGILGN